MAQLFQLDRKGNVFFHKDAMNLCIELTFLTEKERRALVLYVDYYSPFSQLPEDDKKSKAMIQVFGTSKIDIFAKQTMVIAIEKYKSLQYDPKRELKRYYIDKIQLLSNELLITVKVSEITNIIKAQDIMNKAIDKLEMELLEQQEINLNIKGGGGLSFIDKAMSNKEDYERAIALKTK